MLCPACRATNDENARFCDQCGHPYETCCPTCGSPARAGARFCQQCGQSLALRLDPAPSTPAPSSLPARTPSLDDKLDQLQRYLPSHLADKVLANQGRLEGERKLVTVLFADIVDYTALSAQLGEEALFALMDEIYEVLIHEVHRYEGTVNELTGDGIVAFFGAPLAVEQAPQRAVRAALALQDAVAHCSARWERERGVRLQVRVGINTGPVIVGTVGNTLRMDYKAVGNTVNLAARMEQTAAPGTIQITAHTHKLVAGYVDCDALGLVSVKGLATRVRVYRVTGERGVRARIDVARERGLTGLAGRERELALLRQCFALVQGGRGQAVSIIGDAGLGKSRLLHEFRQDLARTDVTWLDGRCSPYGAALAYLPVVELVKQYFRIDAGDSTADIRRKVHHRLESCSPVLEAVAPYLCHLLAADVDGGLPAGLSPDEIKRRIFEALRVLVLEGMAQRPLVVALEDLHWADHTTVEFVTFLLDHIAGARVLLVCTHRPEFASMWSRKSYHSVITLPPLAYQDGYQMLTSLLSPTPIQDALATFVLDKAEGVPFFLEELVQSLQEMGVIERHDGQWQLTPGATAVTVPDTVEELLTARIDRLPEGAKSVLQVGAVMGREFRWEVLKAITSLEDQELLAHLRALTDAELLYGRGLPPQATYLFKHAFTQEAAYGSLLTPRRHDLHRRVAVTLEALFADRLEEHYGQLAYHYFEAGQGDAVGQASAYAVRAGSRAMALAAYEEAVRFYQMALQALERQAPVDETQRCALLLALGEAHRKAGVYPQAMDTFQRAADIARTLGLPEDLAQAALGFEETSWQPGLPGNAAARLLEEALQALGEGDSTLKARVLGGLVRALAYTDAFARAAVVDQQALEMARRSGEPSVLLAVLHTSLSAQYARWGLEHIAARVAAGTELLRLAEAAGDRETGVNALSWRLFDLMVLGHIQEVETQLAAHTRLAEELRQPFYLYINVTFRAMRAVFVGRFEEAERLAQEALALGQRLQGQDALGIFGVQMFTLRREQGRLTELEPVVRGFVQQHAAAATWRPGLALIYSELGRQHEARVEFEHLARHDFADIPQDARWVTCIVYLCEVCAFLGDARRAAVLYQFLLPYDGYNIVVGPTAACYGAAARYLGLLAATMARWDEAERLFADALAMNARMGAWPWLAHTQYDYTTMLLARGRPEDHARVVALLDEAGATAGDLGMRALAACITTRLHPLAPPHQAAPLPAALPPAMSTYPNGLSQREVEVLRLIAVGQSNREIAEALYISLHTVASHVRNILTKTGTANRTEAAAYAMRHGLTGG